MQRREGRVEFLGEQSGSVEDLIKRDLMLEFATRPDIRRAYLAMSGISASKRDVGRAVRNVNAAGGPIARHSGR